MILFVTTRSIGWRLWRPQLRDPNDEMILEVAVNGRADVLITLRDFGRDPAQFGSKPFVEG